MSFEIEGKLHKKFDTENKTASFQAREFVIETEGTYPQFVKFQLTQDRCGAIEQYQEGQQIKVHFDLRGREWNGKYFTNLNAWRIEQAANEDVPADNMPNTEDFPTVGDEPPATEYSDDLPF